MIWEPKKVKSLTVATVSPFICHEVMGPDAMRDKVNRYEKLNTLLGNMNNTKLVTQTSHAKHSEENAMIVKAMGT